MNRQIVRIPSIGKVFVTGISSAYDSEYYPLQLQGIIDSNELNKIIDGLNTTLESYWPCEPCFMFGFACAACTMGTSLLCPNYCISDAEKHAHRYLENISLKSQYYDRDIKFTLRKEWMGSCIEISYPKSLNQVYSIKDIESSGRSTMTL